MSREGKLVKNTLILSIGTFLPKVATFITLPLLTGYLTKEEYGTYDLITILVSLVLPAITLQIQVAAFRFLIDQRKNQQEVKSIITNIYAFIIPSSFIALTILFFVLPESDPLNRLFICLYFFIDTFVGAARQVARGLEKNLDYSISSIVSAGGKIVFAFLFVWYFKLGLFGAILSLFGACMLSLIFLIFKVKLYTYIDVKAISWAKIKQLIAYSWPIVPNDMSMWVMRVSDRFVITMVMGPAANAVYAVANKIPSLLTLAQSTFTMAWQENASIASKDEDADAYYSAMFRTMFDLMAGFLGLLICIAPILFKILIRGDYNEAYTQIPILFIAMFLFSMCSFIGGIYVAYMKTKSLGVTTVISAACNLAVNLALIKFIGLYAASISTLVSYLLLFIYRMIDMKKFVTITYSWGHMLIVFGIMIVESVLCFFQNPILNIINTVFGVVVFLVLNQSFVKAVWKKGTKMIGKKTKKS